ncbi:MAG TPA: tRNA uridine-5-carboxymethylaminomethyl(34) synthesis GTPase MnmE [Longimicrobiaceae bacterium]|nr:tRNA uridine-5-carboxymethylaminomethyl(34) synthesis GTPase MnmE [Longimicrobiaceae bacterium]
MTAQPFRDTIAAVATAAGRGATALVRVSGPDALPILLRICPALEGAPPPARLQRLLAVRHPETGELLDRGLVSLFPAPGSYTGEDTVEISTHGGVLTPQLVLDALLAAGARPAEPGEFTRRAYLNGKLDLLQAEAVLDLIDSSARALHRAAVHQMERGLSRRIEELRTAIIQTEALLVYSIDFPEEDEPPVPPERIQVAAAEVIRHIDALLATVPEGEMLREGALVVLAGRPNSGKSSLFNALLGVERAIVTEIPGTTRDALEASLTLDGYPFRLVDTAGLRETADVVEEIGIEVAWRYLQAAQLVLFCAEGGAPLDADELQFLARLDAARTLLVRTKADQNFRGEAQPGASDREVHVSAHTGAGLPELRDRLLRMAFGGILGETGEAPLVTRERHARALRAAREEVVLFLASGEEGIPMELAATNLRAAAGALEDLLGVITPDDLLGQVFGQFCVGK